MLYSAIKKTVCWGLVAACMIVIFLFSAQTSGESVSTSNSVIETLATLLNPDFAQLDAEEQNNIYALYSNAVRKLAHFAIYALLGFLVSLALCNYPLRYRKIFLYSLGICAVYAITDEVHQIFVPGRGPGVLDVLIDSAGAFCGSCILLCIVYGTRCLFKKGRTAKSDTYK